MRGVRKCEFVTWKNELCDLPAPAYEDGKDYCLFHFNHLAWLRSIRNQKIPRTVRRK